MKISVFTPTNDTTYLDEAYRWMVDGAWDEWVVVLNGGAKWDIPAVMKDRIKVIEFPGQTDSVGALKKFACEQCTGDILVELDHDDIILPDAFRKIRHVFENAPDVGFVYSNWAEFENDYQARPRYSENYGWKYRRFQVPDQPVEKPRFLDEVIAFPPIPSAVSKIWYAPNHLRAWRKTVYDEIGGHNPNLDVLDDLDLMCRTARVCRMHQIDECLYLYRVTGKNTNLERNEKIQQGVWPIYEEHICHLALAWSMLNRLKWSVNDPNFESNVLTDSSDKYGYVVLEDRAQLWENPEDKMRHLWRILAHGGMAFITVPSTDGRGAFQDPRHKSFWNENSFWYYTRRGLIRGFPEGLGFQLSFSKTYFPTDWHRQYNIPYTEAHLVAIKNRDSRIPGIIEL